MQNRMCHYFMIIFLHDKILLYRGNYDNYYHIWQNPTISVKISQNKFNKTLLHRLAFGFSFEAYVFLKAWTNFCSKEK